jgi:hypothetical protein
VTDAETKEYIVDAGGAGASRLYTLIAAHDYCVAGRFVDRADMRE